MLTLAVVVNAESKAIGQADDGRNARFAGKQYLGRLFSPGFVMQLFHNVAGGQINTAIGQRLDACANTPKGHAVVKFAGEFSQ
ncbi:hypothetical protein D3C80_1903680 [compost metagenome]